MEKDQHCLQVARVPFDPEQLYESQVDWGGAVVANISSVKAAGQLETKEKIKNDDQDTTTTTLAINQEKDVKQNMIELPGEVVTHPTFYQIEDEGASGAALPTLMMVIPLMVNHVTEAYTMDDDNEVDDYE